ncbi:MAG: hypothetical protein AB7H97_11030 [Pseudobdellovibrionaceae bacterium]
MKKLFLKIIFIGLAISVFAPLAFSQGLYDHVKKKGEAKKSSRWTLEEWLAQRDRNRMMDLWLSMNSASPYEFYLGSEHLGYTDTRLSPAPQTKDNFVSSRAQLGAFSSLVGVEGEYENNSKQHYSDLTGLLSLRLFGNAVQSTNITLSYGNRNRSLQDITVIRQQLVQVALTLYLMKSFGLDGTYRYYIPSTNEALGKIETVRWQSGVFIDFDFLRIYGNYFKETFQTTPDSGVVQKNERSGVQSGIKIFF